LIQQKLALFKHAERLWYMPRILLIEDDLITREIYDALLCQHGHEVSIAGDVRTGWEKLQGEVFDAALLDLVLPDTHGLELLRKIRANKKTKDLPVIVYTGFFVPTIVEEAKESGATRMFDKAHLSATTLIDALNECLIPGQKAA
jgi:CheY-like chemotaxis protein